MPPEPEQLALQDAERRADALARQLDVLRDEAVTGLPHCLDTDLGARVLYATLGAVLPAEPVVAGERDWTPDTVRVDGTRTITVKRCCNGCGEKLGDVSVDEIDTAVFGAGLPDVRGNCPRCCPDLAVSRHRWATLRQATAPLLTLAVLCLTDWAAAVVRTAVTSWS